MGDFCINPRVLLILCCLPTALKNSTERKFHRRPRQRIPMIEMEILHRFQRMKKSWEKLTCPVGLVALGGYAGNTAAHVVNGNDAELIIDVGREAQLGRVDVAGIPGMVVPYSRLAAILLELHNVVWEEWEGLGWGKRGFSVAGEEGGGFGGFWGFWGQTCDGAVVVVARDPGQCHAPLGQIRQLQVPGTVRAFCWNGINEVRIVPGASPSSHHLSQPLGQDVLRGTIHVLQLFRGQSDF